MMNESFEEEELLTCYDNFDAMGLHENLLKGIYAYGLEKPYTIQQGGIVPISRGIDVILQAQPGSGKTTCLCIGILQQINHGLSQCQAVVMTPTRELARQTAALLEALGGHIGVGVCVCVGGIAAECRGIAGGAHVAVGTPGRVFGLVHRGDVRVDCIRAFVLDGADEILSRGFTDQIHEILGKLPSEVQVGVVLATMTPDVLEITRKFMKKPVKILETNH